MPIKGQCWDSPALLYYIGQKGTSHDFSGFYRGLALLLADLRSSGLTGQKRKNFGTQELSSHSIMPRLFVIWFFSELIMEPWKSGAFITVVSETTLQTIAEIADAIRVQPQTISGRQHGNCSEWVLPSAPPVFPIKTPTSLVTLHLLST